MTCMLMIGVIVFVGHSVVRGAFTGCDGRFDGFSAQKIAFQNILMAHAVRVTRWRSVFGEYVSMRKGNYAGQRLDEFLMNLTPTSSSVPHI